AQGVVGEALGVDGLLLVLATGGLQASDVARRVVRVDGVVDALGREVTVGGLPDQAAGVLVVEPGEVGLLPERRAELDALGPGEDVVLGVAHQGSAFAAGAVRLVRSEEHTSELQSRENLVCRLLLEKKK